MFTRHGSVAGFICLLLSFSFGLLCQAQSAVGSHQTIMLNSGWEFRQRMEGPGLKEAEWRPAEVPGVVHTDLLGNKLIPDPFYRDNESKLQWIENADWEYRSAIQATPEVLKHRNIELFFQGLDAYAEVYLNGKLILTADNMFREWRVDVKPLLKPGANDLLVVFPSVIRMAAKIATTDKWQSKTGTADKTYIRKAAYEYGWDWGPRFVTSGIWRSVTLELWDTARISDLHIRQRDVNADLTHLTVEVEVTAAENVTAKLALDYVHRGKQQELSRTVALRAGVSHIDIPVEVNKPELWYPAGYGPQTMYKFGVHLKINNRPEDERSARTGLRSVVLRRDLDQWGRSFEFVVNGIPVFAQGRGRDPLRQLPQPGDHANYRRVLQSAQGRQHEHDPPLGRRLLRDRRVLRLVRRARHHGLAGLHVR